MPSWSKVAGELPKLIIEQTNYDSGELDTLVRKAKKEYPRDQIDLAINNYIRFGNSERAFFLMDRVRFMRVPGTCCRSSAFVITILTTLPRY